MKYAPPNEAGEKPWVVTVTTWGRSTDYLIYAHKRNEAEYEAKGRQLYTYAKGRRATPADVAELDNKHVVTVALTLSRPRAHVTQPREEG